jgi:hypothetical protein
MSAAQLNTAYTGASPRASIPSGSKKLTQNFPNPKYGFHMGADGSRKITGDSLATGKSLAQRLADKKSGAFVPKSSKPHIPPVSEAAAKTVSKGGGLISKALSLAKRNPIATAAGVAGAAAFGIGRASKKSEPQY